MQLEKGWCVDSLFLVGLQDVVVWARVLDAARRSASHVVLGRNMVLERGGAIGLWRVVKVTGYYQQEIFRYGDAAMKESTPKQRG